MQGRANHETQLSLFRSSATKLKSPLELSLLDPSAANLKGPLIYSLMLHLILLGTMIGVAVFLPQPETGSARTSDQGLKVIYYWPKFDRYKIVPYVRRLSKMPKPAPPPKTASYVPRGDGIAGGAPFDTSVSLLDGRRGAGMIEVRLAGFAAQFPQYVGSVQRRVSNNWQESPSSVPRVCIATFTILPAGAITNIRVTQSSGDRWADMSAVHAIEDSSPVDPLPEEYARSPANVEFQFDFRRRP